MLDSPRHWNCGLLRYRNKLWLSYRFHLKHHAGRCATAIVQLDEQTFQPCGESQHLELSGPVGTEHHEDARLFIFRGEPYISYTEMRGYRPGVDYTCIMKYARLKLTRNRWSVVESWQPRWANNDARGKEKNWVFFEHANELHAVYSGSPNHVVIKLNGERVVENWSTPGPMWHWGAVRGGTPPVLMPDGTFLSIFHSSIPTEIAPHYVRYYGAAYTFEAKPPFAPLKISTRPIAAGSEEDGHKVDPRYVDGWKPYVVFPCGLVHDGGAHGLAGIGKRFLMSAGVNDWACAVARIGYDDFHLGAADGSEIHPRFFRCENGSMPVRSVDEVKRPTLLHWTVPRPGGVGSAPGYMQCGNPREAQEVAENPGVTEISAAEFERANMRQGVGAGW